SGRLNLSHAGSQRLRASEMRKDLVDASHSRSRSETSRRHLFARCFFGEEGPRQRQITRPRDFDVTFGSTNDRNGMAKPFDETRFIRAVVLVSSGTFERLFQDVGAKHLRGLRKDQMLSR